VGRRGGQAARAHARNLARAYRIRSTPTAIYATYLGNERYLPLLIIDRSIDRFIAFRSRLDVSLFTTLALSFLARELLETLPLSFSPLGFPSKARSLDLKLDSSFVSLHTRDAD